MISLLIVEDNNFERESLKECINWELVGIGKILTASDGQEGLDIINEHNPDIVLTDIKMPRMDGLEMLENVSKVASLPKFVFCSAFEEFSYIKQAMRKGAANYLLKPVNQKELIQTIREITNTIIDEKLYEDERKRYRDKYNHYIDAIKINFLKDLVLNGQRKKAHGVYTTMSDIYLKIHAGYRVASIEIFYKDDEKTSKYGYNEKLIHELRISSIRNKAEFFFNDSGILIALFHSIKGEIDSCNTISLLRSTLLSIKTQISFDFFIGVSSITMDITNINSLYYESHRLLEKRIILGYGKIEYFSNIEQGEDNFCPDQKSIQNAIENVIHKTVMGQETDTAFNELETTLKQFYSGNIHGIQSVLVKLISDLLAHSYNKHGKQTENLDYEIYQNVIKARSLPGAIAYVKQFCEDIRDKMSINSKSKVDKLVEQLIEILNTEYHENITLNYLSKKVFLSANYIRLIFKEKTKLSILEYLIRLRMEKAKELLANSDLIIADISNMVGYPNSSYFCTVFKNETGISPLEFRRMKKVEGV